MTPDELNRIWREQMGPMSPLLQGPPKLPEGHCPRCWLPFVNDKNYMDIDLRTHEISRLPECQCVPAA
jgi:hypothetical protein